MKKIRNTILSLILFLGFISCDMSDSNNNINPASKKDWTIMVYLDADNDLEAAGLEDFNEMERGLQAAIDAGNPGIENQLNIIVMIDRCDGYVSSPTTNGGSDWKDTRLYRIKPDTDYYMFNSERLKHGESGEKNMGDPATLSSFISFTKKYYPADNYGLILWNHGGGTRSLNSSSSSGPSRAMCWDEGNDNDALYLDEVQQALSENFSQDDKLSLIGFDMCLMAMVEVAYEFRNLADYMVGSMEEEQGDGWDYTDILGNINTVSPTPRELASNIVDSYHNYIEAYGRDDGQTQSAIDLSKIEGLKTEIDKFAAAIYNENKKSQIEDIRDSSVHFYHSENGSIDCPFFDLNTFCNKIASDSTGISDNLKLRAEAVITELSKVVIKAYGEVGTNGNNQEYYYGDGASVKRGLSIFFSRGNKIYSPDVSTNDPHYVYQWWYTDVDTQQWWEAGKYYGLIDFCNSNTNGTVETWRELMEAWYDNTDNSSATPGAW